jgi:hypothetical protein
LTLNNSAGQSKMNQHNHTAAASNARKLEHVGDVEEARGGADVRVLVDHAVLVLQRHLPAGIRHHLGALLDVQVVQRRALQRAGSLVVGMCEEERERERETTTTIMTKNNVLGSQRGYKKSPPTRSETQQQRCNVDERNAHRQVCGRRRARGDGDGDAVEEREQRGALVLGAAALGQQEQRLHRAVAERRVGQHLKEQLRQTAREKLKEEEA